MQSTISGWRAKMEPAPAEQIAGATGVDLCEAEPLVPILVRTKNSVYRVIPLRRGDADVVVQGGRFFPSPAEARLVGATFGGCLVQMHWIRVGMCMEIRKGSDDGLVITTRVIDVEVERESTVHSRTH